MLLCIEFRVSSLKVRVSSVKLRVSSLRIRVSSLKLRVSSLRIQEYRPGLQLAVGGAAGAGSDWALIGRNDISRGMSTLHKCFCAKTAQIYLYICVVNGMNLNCARKIVPLMELVDILVHVEIRQHLTDVHKKFLQQFGVKV